MKSLFEFLATAFGTIFSGRAGSQRADFAAITDSATKLTVSWEKLADTMSARLESTFETIKQLEQKVSVVQDAERECKDRVSELEGRLSAIERKVNGNQ